MADSTSGGGNVRASNLDVIATIQRMEISMTERFARLETSYGYVADRLNKIEGQYEQVRDMLRNIETSQAGADAGMAELRKTYAELERDIHSKTGDFEARIRQLEKHMWQTSAWMSGLAFVGALVFERIVFPLLLR